MFGEAPLPLLSLFLFRKRRRQTRKRIRGEKRPGRRLRMHGQRQSLRVDKTIQRRKMSGIQRKVSQRTPGDSQRQHRSRQWQKDSRKMVGVKAVSPIHLSLHLHLSQLRLPTRPGLEHPAQQLLLHLHLRPDGLTPATLQTKARVVQRGQKMAGEAVPVGTHLLPLMATQDRLQHKLLSSEKSFCPMADLRTPFWFHHSHLRRH